MVENIKLHDAKLSSCEIIFIMKLESIYSN